MLTKFYFYEKLLALNEIAAADEVDKVAYNKVRRCFTQIITNYGFFAELLFQLNIIEANKNSGVDTMATDGITIAYSPEFVKKLTEPEVVFVIIHEVMHNANFHFDRQGNRDHQLWNCAADYAINIQIDDMRKDMNSTVLSAPKAILLDEKYRGLGAEDIYELLKQQQKQGQGQGKGKGKPGQGQPGQGQPGQGQPGQPGQGQDGGTPEGDIRQPGSLDGKGKEVYKGNAELGDIKDPAELAKKWADIRNNAASKNAGSGSASMDRWLRKVNKPKINWRAELKKFIKQVYDQIDYGFFNKRFIGRDMYLPGPKEADTGSYENVIIAIDTSGSISDDTLGKFASEMAKLFKQYNIKKCHIIWCDSEISSIQTFDVNAGFDIGKLKPTGGGGTSFKPPFEWVQKNVIKKGKVPAFFIYFTDAFGEAPSIGEYGIRSYAARVLWVITENDNADNIKFGKKIYIDKLPG
jgi:predicted metal-dependent peptidase